MNRPNISILQNGGKELNSWVLEGSVYSTAYFLHIIFLLPFPAVEKVPTINDPVGAELEFGSSFCPQLSFG